MNTRKTARNAALVADRKRGLSLRALAKKYGLALTRVVDICNRDMTYE